MVLHIIMVGPITAMVAFFARLAFVHMVVQMAFAHEVAWVDHFKHRLVAYLVVAEE